MARDLSLHTQVSLPYSHQSQSIIDRFRKTIYGQVRAIRIGLADHLGACSDQVEGSFMPMEHSAYSLPDQQVFGQIRWEDIIQERPSKRLRRLLLMLVSMFLLTFQSQPPAQIVNKCRFVLHLRNQRCCGWDVVIGMHTVSFSGGQILKTCTVTRLAREEQFNVSEFKDFKICDSRVICGLSGDFL